MYFDSIEKEDRESKTSIIYMHVHVFNILSFLFSFGDGAFFPFTFSRHTQFFVFLWTLFTWDFTSKHKFPIGRGK